MSKLGRYEKEIKIPLKLLLRLLGFAFNVKNLGFSLFKISEKKYAYLYLFFHDSKK